TYKTSKNARCRLVLQASLSISNSSIDKALGSLFSFLGGFILVVGSRCKNSSDVSQLKKLFKTDSLRETELNFKCSNLLRYTRISAVVIPSTRFLMCSEKILNSS